MRHPVTDSQRATARPCRGLSDGRGGSLLRQQSHPFGVPDDLGCSLVALLQKGIQVPEAARSGSLYEGDGSGQASQLFEIAHLHRPLCYGGYGALPGVFEPAHAARPQKRLQSLASVGEPHALSGDPSRGMVCERVYPVPALRPGRVVGNGHAHSARVLRNSASLLDTVRAMRTRARMSAVHEYSPRSVSSCSARRTYSLR